MEAEESPVNKLCGGCFFKEIHESDIETRNPTMKTLNVPYKFLTDRPFSLLKKTENGYSLSAFLDLFNKPIIISINEEHGAEHDLNHIDLPVLKLFFSDVTKTVRLANGDEMNPIRAAECHKIFDFVGANKPDLVIVNCWAGISRSAAVCLALNYIYGAALPNNFWEHSYPNPFCLGKILAEYRKANK